MDDKEDREVTLQEIKTTLWRKVLDSIADYNEFLSKNYPKEPTMYYEYGMTSQAEEMFK